MNSVITVQSVIEELESTYLDDEKSDVYNLTSKLRQIQRACQFITLKVSDQAPSILMRSVTIPYVFGTTEYPLVPRSFVCGTTNLSATVTSSGQFTAGDVGTGIRDGGIVKGAAQ